MKQIILALMASTILCASAEAQIRKGFQADSLNRQVRVLELKGTTVNGKTSTDTLSVTAYTNDMLTDDDNRDKDYRINTERNETDIHVDYAEITSIVGIILLPIIIVGISVFFRFIAHRRIPTVVRPMLKIVFLFRSCV